ncbi:MFS transporter [Agromyces sp. MMS24-JH15]|uniref:MFS transporter n=1 Tax=Agromyces sp. MMS24-JH15 TaxID=3243765 RepID=UPI0037482B0A
MAAPEHQSLSRGVVARYAIGSIGTGGFATLPGLVLVYYLTDTLGVVPLFAGLVVTAAKVWDVVIDPWIGDRSDRALARRGTRRGMMLAGAIALPIGFALTFAVPAGLVPGASAVWVLLAFLATATAFSLFQVPYIALPAELTPGYDGRTRLLTWRVVVLTLSILAFGAGGPEIRAAFEDEYLGYLVMAIVAGLAIGVGMLVASTVAPRGARSAENAGAASADARAGLVTAYRDGIAALRRSIPFRALLGAFVLQGLATGLMLAGAQFVATWVLGDPRATTFLFASLIAPAVVFAPIWGRIARRVGKERGFRWATLLFVVATAALIGMIWAPGPWIYAPVAVAGAAYAGMQSLPMAMLPDVITHDARREGVERAGSFSGVWTAGETAGMALGATVLTVVLAVTGYVESVGDQVVAQSPAAIAGIVLAFSAVPAALTALSLVAIARYPLGRADVDIEPEALEASR